MVQNTPTGCGNDLPIFLGIDFLGLKSRSVNYFFVGAYVGRSRYICYPQGWNIATNIPLAPEKMPWVPSIFLQSASLGKSRNFEKMNYLQF